jgi:protein-S-isoprenylcysteine O-methyltransferase Ste14
MVFNKLPLLFFLAFLAALLFKILFLKRKGVQTRAKNETKNKTAYFLYPAFALVFLLWLFELVKVAFSFSAAVLPNMLTEKILQCLTCQITGSIVLLLSFVFWIITLLNFKNSLRFGLDENMQGKLITRGIFSVTRNPFFLSVNLYFLGVALIFPSLFFIGFTLAAFVGIHFFILKEEQFLQKVYGTGYLNYKNKTRRYF